jgi:nitrogen fixation protein FixH
MNISRPFTGRTVLIWLLGFFGLVFVVNGAFIYYAEHSFPGLSAQNAYETGLDYNRVLKSADEQRLLGWQVVLSVEPQTKSLILKIRDEKNIPLDDLTVVAELRRPAEADDDRQVHFTHTGPGIYRADGALSASGTWNATLHIQRADRDEYVLEQRLLVP